MKPPFILIENINDLSIYHNLEDLIKSMEVIDVLNNEYQVYDSEGYLLEINVYSKTGQKIDNPQTFKGIIRVEPNLKTVCKKEELCQLIIKHLQNYKISLDNTKHNNLDYLLLRTLKEIDIPFSLNRKHTFFKTLTIFIFLLLLYIFIKQILI